MTLVRTASVAVVAAAAGLGLAGCAGMPVAVSVASLYVDTVLFLRTEKSAGDHLISAVAERDCGLMNILRSGRLCEDAPPPPLLVAVMREVEGAPPDGPESGGGAPPRTAAAPDGVEVAAAPVGTVSDADPPATPSAVAPTAVAPSAAGGVPTTTAAEAPVAGTRTVVAAAVDAPTGIVGPAGTPAYHAAGRLLVVVGSFTRRDQAEEHRRRFGPGTLVVEAVVDGRTRYRVALPPAGRATALRQLGRARAGGIADAWLLPWDGAVPSASALAALPAADGPDRL
ncbi:SPOR domain-containing protein [Azospirillum sp. ST 5-10]|uniref:SPOR domain-containing protein n=1 Tax=unclassified Azospirillum TaxID=2630922 RepID=UPI003F4A21A9